MRRQTGLLDVDGTPIKEGDAVVFVINGDQDAEAYLVYFDHYYKAWGLTGTKPGVGSYHRVKNVHNNLRVVGEWSSYDGKKRD